MLVTFSEDFWDLFKFPFFNKIFESLFENRLLLTIFVRNWGLLFLKIQEFLKKRPDFFNIAIFLDIFIIWDLKKWHMTFSKCAFY